MKKNLLIAIAAFLIVGCSKNNNETPVIPLKDDIVATWASTSDIEVITKDGAYWNTFTIPGYVSLTFKNDGTGTKLWKDSLPRKFTYSISENIITFNFEEVPMPDGAVAVAFTEHLEVKSITANKLVLIYQDDVTQNGSLYHTVETQEFSR
ncbi:lipocalin-like domain-containing protein [Mucilaginibacter pedocola]|nr:lipocalin family protein [Mucilaginibacter pedocola]